MILIREQGWSLKRFLIVLGNLFIQSLFLETKEKKELMQNLVARFNFWILIFGNFSK